MEKKLSDYLYFYIGCEAITVHSKPEIITGRMVDLVKGGFSRAKPILRKLSDITEEEKDWLGEHENFVDNYKQNAENYLIIEWDAEKTIYLLSRHFDLFGLIEAGLAIDATTLNQKL